MVDLSQSNDFATLVAVVVPVGGALFWTLRTLLRLDSSAITLKERIETVDRDLEARLNDIEKTTQERHDANRKDIGETQSVLSSQRTVQATLSNDLSWIKSALLEIKDNLRPHPPERRDVRDAREARESRERPVREDPR